MTTSEFFKEMDLHASPNYIKSSIAYVINQDVGDYNYVFIIITIFM
jgi:hypothetical protein